MSCYCSDCSALRKARSVIDEINLLKLLSSQEPEALQVALCLSTADKHLREAQDRLAEKHPGGTHDSGGSTTSSATPRAHGGGQHTHPGYGPHDHQGHQGHQGQNPYQGYAYQGQQAHQGQNAYQGQYVHQGQQHAHQGQSAYQGQYAPQGQHATPGQYAHQSQYAPASAGRANAHTPNGKPNSHFHSSGGGGAGAREQRGKQRDEYRDEHGGEHGGVSLSEHMGSNVVNQNGNPGGKENEIPARTESRALVLHKSNSSSSGSNSGSPEHGRNFSGDSSLTNPWAGRDEPVLPEGFEESVRNRAAELRILRGGNMAENDAVDDDEQQSSTDASGDGPDPLLRQTKFVVCDHCRAHGISCNEASICKECVLRELPCTHRICDLSPNSKEDCPRPICFYVHADWMPDMYGQHNPADANWIVLPGKIRDHLCAGSVTKLPPMTEDEIKRCYQGAHRRQMNAKINIQATVQRGETTYETATISCACAEYEYELSRAKIAKQKALRMEQFARSRGINI